MHMKLIVTYPIKVHKKSSKIVRLTCHSVGLAFDYIKYTSLISVTCRNYLPKDFKSIILNVTLITSLSYAIYIYLYICLRFFRSVFESNHFPNVRLHYLNKAIFCYSD